MHAAGRPLGGPRFFCAPVARPCGGSLTSVVPISYAVSPATPEPNGTMSESSAHPGPLASLERRVLGVLVEKAKTTPDSYPLSLNALRTGCNQKSNRFPQMDLDEEQVERAADSLRIKGALTVVQGDSRVERYRHRMYDWLGVEKAELAVLAELLVRGAQSIGDLRGRAARMEPISGISELKPLLETLVGKGFVEYLTPPGRGAIVSHCFYSDSERERVLRDQGVGGQGAGGQGVGDGPATGSTPAVPSPAVEAGGSDLRQELQQLTERVDELEMAVQRLQQRVEG